jgi:hypothetical protein
LAPCAKFELSDSPPKAVRNDILDCYQKYIITGASWKKILDTVHIMPFGLVGSSVETGFLLRSAARSAARKKLHFLWDKYEKSIDPEIWIKNLSKEAFNNCDEYRGFHLTKISDNAIVLLKENAEIELLKMQYDKFLQVEEKRLIFNTKNRHNKDDRSTTKRSATRKKNPKLSKIPLYGLNVTSIDLIIIEFISLIWNNKKEPSI